MKVLRLRFAVFCLAIFCFVCVPITKPIFQFYGDEKTTYYFYADATQNNIKNATIIQNGNTSIVACEIQFADIVKSRLSNIYGESLRITNYKSKTLQNILDKFLCYCVKTEEFDDYKSLLCYNLTLSNFVFVDEQKVNMQIAYNKTEINIGYPLILNGF